VIVGKNLNRAGAIELTLPDGQKQKKHPWASTTSTAPTANGSSSVV
jgi:hypothetical protein